jgi:hypothetical protein
MGKVRCADCGFCGPRSRLTNNLDEANEAYLREANFGAIVNGGPLYGGPICAKSLISFPASHQPSMVAEMNQERECSGFLQRLIGRTPKEHQEMVDRILRHSPDWRRQ